MYTIAFMCVMTSMAVCHILFKYVAPDMPRPFVCGIWQSYTAACLTTLAFVVECINKPYSFVIFLIFYTVVLCVCIFSVKRLWLLSCLQRLAPSWAEWCETQKREIGLQNRMVYFATGQETQDDLLLILRTFDKNEVARHVVFVHFAQDVAGADIAPFRKTVEFAGSEFPDFIVDSMVVVLLLNEEEQKELKEGLCGNTGKFEIAVDEQQAASASDAAARQSSNEAAEGRVIQLARSPESTPVGVLSPQGVLWTAEHFNLRTNDFVMGVPGSSCQKLEVLLGVRLMPTKTLVC